MIEDESLYHKSEQQINTDKPTEEGWEPINFDLSSLNFEKAFKKHAFYNSINAELS